jgi:hypothetical protein
MPSNILLAHNANTAEGRRPKLILPIGSGRTGVDFGFKVGLERSLRIFSVSTGTGT